MSSRLLRDGRIVVNPEDCCSIAGPTASDASIDALCDSFHLIQPDVGCKAV